MYLVLSAFTSSPISLVATNKFYTMDEYIPKMFKVHYFIIY